MASKQTAFEGVFSAHWLGVCLCARVVAWSSKAVARAAPQEAPPTLMSPCTSMGLIVRMCTDNGSRQLAV